MVTSSFLPDRWPTELEQAQGWLACAVAYGGHLEHEEQDELIENFRREVLRDAAKRVRTTEAKRFPGPILGAIRRMRANYYAKIIDPNTPEES
ncbi:hypothetical protein [Kitasatospora fiedleri]|uniref:hypothetical protein n=1 Tax=Kitasatospora fiedleri TaxID=2991545 RepID=UPI00249B5C3D|nr:hypothetical protein [Kitasatospora fiedleri]